MAREFNKAPQTPAEKLYRFAEIERLVELSGTEREPLLGPRFLVQELIYEYTSYNTGRVTGLHSNHIIY